MPIQIFGTKKCKDTQKAIRFFKERRINTHFIDLNEKAMSPGELKNVSRVYPAEQLIDTESREYEKLNLKYMKYNAEEILLEHPLLFKTPIVINGPKVSLGYEPDKWKDWK